MAFFTDENNQINIQELAYWQTASDWLSVAKSQTTKHTQTVFSHSRAIKMTATVGPSDGIVKSDAA